MENSGKKYQIDTEENKMFLGELQKNLLNFGKGFLSPGGSAYFLGDDGTPWKDRNRETWITCRMVHVYSMGIMLGDKESPALVHGAVHGLLEELKDRENGGWYPGITPEFPIVKDTTPNMMNPRLYTTSYNKPQGQQFETAVLSFIKLQYTEKSCKMINIFVLVTILGHLPVILSAKSKGSEDMKQILIVEDDSFLNKMVDYNLTADGYGVTSALNARTAAEAIRQREFDLVLLDINLPDGNGFELCKLIKPQHPDTIVIFLTANDQESDQIRGYEVGAVDYITKPFVIGALQRKIKAMFAMLEHHKPAKDIYDDGRLFLDFSEQTASLNGKPLTLSPMEYKMLNLFRKNPRQVLTRGQLLEKLWDIDERFVDEHTLTTSISRIRSKIESDGGAPYIKTVYGMGYQWTGGEAK